VTLRLPAHTLLLAGLLALAAPLQAQYFGRNKVQYQPFDFEVIRTEHFDVHFYPQERQAAMDAARLAERAYARLSRVLQHEFDERKPIILYASHSDFQQTNTLHGFIEEGTGGVTEAAKRRIIMPFTGSYAEFEHVFTHELVHAFQYDIIFRSALRDVTPFGFRPHLWFMEGMAEYLSVGRIDANTHAWLRDAVTSGYMRSIAEMSRRDDYLSYRFGQSLWTYIGGKWGDEVVGVLLQRAPRMGLDRAFEMTLGVTLDELSDEWLTQVRSTYLPQTVDMERPHQFATRLTDHESLSDPWFVAPAISPNGRRMTYLSQREGFFLDLWLADAQTGEPIERLVEASREADFESLRYSTSSAAFAPDGRRLVFAAQHGGRDVLYVYDVEARRVTRRLEFELNGIANPTWAPDGQRIAFTGLDGGISDLFVTDLQGRLLRLTRDRYADLMPAWSPDGRSIAFATDRGPDTDFERLSFGNLRVAVYDLDSDRIRVLPHQEQGRNLNPVWAPDSRSLVWVGDRTGTHDLYLFELDTERLSRITRLLSGVLSATAMTPTLSWARDDGRLLFVYFERAGYNIYSVADPRALRRDEAGAPAFADATGGEPDGEASDPPQIASAPLTPFTVGVVPPAEVAPPVRNAFAGSFYRTDDGFRASQRLEVREPADGPLSLMALLDSAALALPDTSGFELLDYRARLSVDAVGRPSVGVGIGAGGYDRGGVYGGSYLVMSDMLGNHSLVGAASVNGSISDASMLLGYGYLRHRVNLGVGFEQYPLYRYLGQSAFPLANDDQVVTDVWTRDVVRVLSGQIAYPLSSFRRIELGANAYLVSRDTVFRGLNLTAGGPVQITREGRSTAFLQPTAALVFDNSLFGWTGPIYGTRYRLQFSQMLGEYHYGETLADIRQYANWRRAIVLATRVFGLMRDGRDEDVFSYYWGGPYFLRGYGSGSWSDAECQPVDEQLDPQLSFCPQRDQLFGSSFVMATAELRFPVITQLQFGSVASLPPVDAVLFAEGGMAWDDRVCLRSACEGADGHRVRLGWGRPAGRSPLLYRRPLYSAGIGIRLNVFYAVLRLDYAFPLSRPDRGGRFSLAFGPSF